MSVHRLNLLAGLFSRLAAVAESRPEMRAINHLSAMSDEALAARGLTRAGETRRILGAGYFV